MKRIYIIAATAISIFTSCSKESNPPVTGADEKGSIGIEFDNIVGGSDLQLNTATYTNAAGEDYTITQFDYYISNISLIKDDGSVYTVPKNDSYFLIQESDASTHIVELDSVPAADYTGITFTVGVDSAKCTAPVEERTGVLDVAGAGAGMYWSWNSGYIFLKMEGSSDASVSADKKFRYHIGGFGGMTSSTINNIKTITLTIPANGRATVRKDITPDMHLFVDASKLMDGSTPYSIADESTVMFAPFSTTIADNYAGMFKIDHVHND